MAHYADKYNRALKKEKVAKHPPKPAVESRKKEVLNTGNVSFLKRNFDYRDHIIAFEGYEGVMLFIYTLTLPYLIGLAFLYLFIARSNFYLFLELKLSSYLIIWAIGYEVCAVLALGIIFYSWFSDGSTPTDSGKQGKKKAKAASHRKR